jgi:hypothetical protein
MRRLFGWDGRILHDHKTYILPEETRAVAKAAWRAYEQGKVELLQRRVGKQFEYLCIKRKLIEPRPQVMSAAGRIL